MNGYVCKPRPSAYAQAYSVLLREQKSTGSPLTKEQVEHRLKVAPGFMFAQGVTIDDVLDTFKQWRLVKIKDNRIHILTWPKRP